MVQVLVVRCVRCIGIRDDPEKLEALRKEVEDLKRGNPHDKLLNLPLSLLGSMDDHD